MRAVRLLPLALLAVLAACSSPFQSRVARFHQLSPAVAGGSFVVQPVDPELRGGLEFQQYAQEVTRRLVAEGYRPAGSPAQATVLVRLDYGVDDGRERIASRPGLGYGYGSFGYGGFGYGGFGYGGYGRYSRFRGYGYGGFYDPFWGPYGYGFGPSEVYSYTTYNSFVDVEMRRTNSDEVLFEGRAETDSRTDDLTRLVPNLVQAMFTGFPGRSGETVRVSIDDKGRATQVARRD